MDDELQEDRKYVEAVREMKDLVRKAVECGCCELDAFLIGDISRYLVDMYPADEPVEDEEARRLEQENRANELYIFGQWMLQKRRGKHIRLSKPKEEKTS